MDAVEMTGIELARAYYEQVVAPLLLSRWLDLPHSGARLGSGSDVLGLDLSENMLARARADTADLAVQYAKADLENLELPDGAFDVAYSSLTCHYIEDLGRLVRTVFQALTPGGHFVFTIEHPIYMASTRPGWTVRVNMSGVALLEMGHRGAILEAQRSNVDALLNEPLFH